MTLNFNFKVTFVEFWQFTINCDDDIRRPTAMTTKTNWITYIAPYCEIDNSRPLEKNYAKDISNMYVLNCRLNELSIGISLVFR